MHELHPFLATGLDLRVRCELTLSGQSLRAVFTVSGDVEKLRFADRHPVATRRDGLWKTSCFELFLAPKSSSRYWEFNLSPSGDWNCYAFDDYRKGMRPESRVRDVSIRTERKAEFLLEVKIDLHELIELGGALDAAITAVLEDPEGRVSYWAIEHAGAQPDFHLRGSFTAEVANVK